MISTVPTEAVRGDQFTVKIDHRLTDKQNLSIYYYFNDARTQNPFAPFEQAGATLPGFGSVTAERFQQWNITHTWTISSSMVNEFRFNYNREGQETFLHPSNTNSCSIPALRPRAGLRVCSELLRVFTVMVPPIRQCLRHPSFS